MRPTNPAGSIQLQARDFDFLRGLFESRILTISQAADIYFEGRYEGAKKRLQKLKAAGYIKERRRRIIDQAILALTHAGISLLDNNGILAAYPVTSLRSLTKRFEVSEATIRHELAILDVKAAMYRAGRTQEGYSVLEFGTWPRLYAFNAFRPLNGKETVNPDAYIRINEKKSDGARAEHCFFLEVDRSTELIETVVRRVHCYLDYFRSGGFAERNGGNRAEYRQHPFRVLIVCQSIARARNIAIRLRQGIHPIRTFACLSTHGEVVTDPWGAIWIEPKDCPPNVPEFAIERRKLIQSP